MSGNASQGGRSFRGRYPDLHYYDKLPPTARKALADAVFDWSSGWIYGLWRRGELKTGADVAAFIAETDTTQIVRDRHRVWRIEEIPCASRARKRSRDLTARDRGKARASTRALPDR